MIVGDSETEPSHVLKMWSCVSRGDPDDLLILENPNDPRFASVVLKLQTECIKTYGPFLPASNLIKKNFRNWWDVVGRLRLVKLLNPDGTSFREFVLFPFHHPSRAFKNSLIYVLIIDWFTLFWIQIKILERLAHGASHMIQLAEISFEELGITELVEKYRQDMHVRDTYYLRGAAPVPKPQPQHQAAEKRNHNEASRVTGGNYSLLIWSTFKWCYWWAEE